MTASLLAPARHPALAALWGYLAEVTDALGIGPESCVVDHDSPVSAYVALDGRLPGHPDRDVALLWDEVHGWAIAIETHSGEDLIVVCYLGGKTIAPTAARVARFVRALRAGDRYVGQLTPPSLRDATGHADLELALGGTEPKGRPCGTNPR
ncbi:hypothetical protein CFP71_06965 [Amycolatopsis thailandensis]|uniref:DUF6292 domain-containing protein n=1 Tax=Amycolatopsis thailandensis TaxID=589330 RepID=A0A229SF55_9PSEU|nr:DUF6292 family protein [Amycolatopsis thailandensis]OXM57558.1 hypothetical protein CFP71_06965 [Amycolatopsis thailandensis]